MDNFHDIETNNEGASKAELETAGIGMRIGALS